MLAIAAKKLGLYVTVIDPQRESPAGGVSDEQITADFKDEEAIRRLSEKSDVITFEIELANDKVLFELEKKGGTQELLARLRKYRGRLPADFKFDRLEAHENR